MRRSPLHVASLLAVLLGLSPALETGSVRAAPARRAAQQSSVPSKAKPTPAPKTRPASQTPARRPKPQPRTTPPEAKPDRSLFQSAQRAEKALRASRQKKAKRSEWERVASAYRKVVDRYPRSPYCDDALLKAGDLQREMGDLFANRKYSDQALESYALIVEEYPGSRRGGPALFATYEILLARAQKPGARAAAEKYLAAYPDGSKAKALKQALAESIPVRATREAEKTEIPLAPTGGSQFGRSEGSGRGQIQVFGVRFWSGESSTRVVIDLDRKVEIKQDRLQSPPRLFVDLIGTRLHPNLVGKTFPVGNAFLKQIRVGVNRQNVVRVVIDFGEASSHSVFFLADPERLVIDIRGEASKNMRTAASDVRPSGSANPADRVNATPPQEVMERVEITQRLPVNPDPTPEPEAPGGSRPPVAVPAPPHREDADASGAEPRVTSASSRPAPSASALPVPASTPLIPEAPPRSPSPAPSLSNANTTPTRNRDGTYSLARQLGLGARRICLDAGHGGHDPGAIGRGGTQEKDVTLAVVLKLEKLIRSELGADVVLTRDTDVFIPLEERTAIANASGADLFLSVHINSARNSAGRGLETYYLSFAKSAAAEELAARENAISQATMKDLNNLVKAIATNSKIDESRDFAGIVQRGNIDGLSSDFRGVLDRGVHTAPFYVLIGANMPSILTEVGFISNPDEERWLKSDEYQSKLALSLLEGVRSYLGQLNRNQASRLGGRSGVRVAAKGRSNR